MGNDKLRVRIQELGVGFLFLALSSLLISACNKRTESSQTSLALNSTKFEQYYVQGQQLYSKHCANCHQENGTGLGLVYPPLNTSDYMEKNFEDVICLIKYGMKGELMVNGKNFNQPMLGVTTLTDLEIAEIATYIYNSWKHKRDMVEVKEVTRMLQHCLVQ